jgi:hypothetical protein
VWCPYGQAGDFPSDQRAEDGQSLSFTSPPLEGPMEILGFPEVTLGLTADRPLALVAVRLCDVAPDGASTLVSWGLLNLTHRQSHAGPTPLEPGKRYTVVVRLNACGHALPAGHRWRVAVSPTYWPHAWPSPEAVTLTLFTGVDCWLALPTRTPRPEDAELPPFAPPETAPLLAHELLRSGSTRRAVHHDPIEGVYRLVEHSDGGRRRLLDSGLEFEADATNTFTIVEGEPLSASVRCERSITVARGDWHTRVETTSLMSADAEQFHVTNVLDAYKGHTRVFTKRWSHSVPRDLV